MCDQKLRLRNTSRVFVGGWRWHYHSTFANTHLVKSTKIAFHAAASLFQQALNASQMSPCKNPQVLKTGLEVAWLMV